MKLSGFIRNRIISLFITFKRNNIMQKKIRDKFQELFNTEGAVFASPGRINLIGEHTDYNTSVAMARNGMPYVRAY